MVVEIIFSGLIAFVKGECNLNNAKQMNIVMVKGDSETHQPRLVADVRYLDPVTAAPDGIVEMPGGPQLAFWDLDNLQVQVVGAPSKIQLYEDHRAKKGNDEYERSKPGGSDAGTDFSWAPELRRACGLAENKAYARREVHADNRLAYKADDGKVVQFATARFAELGVEKLSSKPNRSDNQLETRIRDLERNESKVFKFDGTTYRQVLADMARLTLVLSDEGPLEIRLSELSTSENDIPPVFKKSIVLKKDLGNVSIGISNLPAWERDSGGSPEKVVHFHEYEKLLKNDALVTCPVPTEDPDTNLAELDVYPKSVQPVKCAVCSACGGN